MHVKFAQTMDGLDKPILTPSLRVVLWSAQRCLSSVFERSIRELKAVKVIYEPHQQAYYCGPERKTDTNHPTSSEINVAATHTFDAADDRLLQSFEGYEAVFCKNHAYFIEGNYKRYIEGRFESHRHTFLIRNPHKSIPSLVRARKTCGFPLHPHSNGIEQLYDLFKTVQVVDSNPLVIDADYLLMNPKEVMKQYCCATGLPFEESMLTWTPGVVADWTEFKYYKEWHEKAMMSSGFLKPTATPDPSEAGAQPSINLPEDVMAAIQKALPFYEAMYASRMKF